jgi:hypothetical protein
MESIVYLIETIEHVQKRCIKRIPNLPSLTYLENCAALNLDTRRLSVYLITYNEIPNNLTPLAWDYYLFSIFRLEPPCVLTAESLSRFKYMLLLTDLSFFFTW